MNFKPNDFVQWTGTDSEGKFSHVGQVVICNDDAIEFVTPHGTLHVPTEDGHFRHISRPQGWSTELPKVTKKPVKTAHIKPKQTTTSTVKVGSKKEKALDIYSNLMDNGNHPQRAVVIAEFMDRLEMTKAGASTYHSMVKKLM